MLRAVTHVRQKFKHCFEACLVSTLEDKRLRERQAEIVTQFPIQLLKGSADEGVPQTIGDINEVIVGFGLAAFVHWIFSDDVIVASPLSSRASTGRVQETRQSTWVRRKS